VVGFAPSLEPVVITTAMPELSPAARAVLDAAEDDCIHPADLHKIVAAVLEAAATILRDAYANEEYVDPADDWLDDIAAELKAQ
jgi:hypothetical protein